MIKFGQTLNSVVVHEEKIWIQHEAERSYCYLEDFDMTLQLLLKKSIWLPIMIKIIQYTWAEVYGQIVNFHKKTKDDVYSDSLREAIIPLTRRKELFDGIEYVFLVSVHWLAAEHSGLCESNSRTEE